MRFIALALIAALTWLQPAVAADPRESGPLAIVITYHAAPANRAAFRKAMQESEVPRFERWKSDGVLKEVRILFNRYVDSAAWDAMALITFARYDDLQAWKRIEQASPAGISPATLALTTAIETTPGDFMRAEGRGHPGSTWLVIPYEYVVPVNDYIAYLDGYVVPQLQGWMEEGPLASYGVLLARYPAGRPWQSMLILEYRDDAALGARDATTAKVRERLKANAKWKAISDSKKNVRNEKSPVIADELAPR